MVVRSTANTTPHICHYSDGVTSTMYCCYSQKRKRDPTKKQRVYHPCPAWACVFDPASEKRSRLLTCLLPVLLLLAGSRTTSGFPTAIPALEPTLAARSTCATKDVTRWFSRWWFGSIVSTPTPQGCCGSLYTYKNRLSCGVAPFSFKSSKEDSTVVVSMMACHLPAWPPVGTTGASLMTSSSTVAGVVSRYRPLWRNRCRPASHGPPPLLYQPVLVTYPYVEPELTAEAHRHPKMAAAKAEDLQRAFAVCCIRCPWPCLPAWVVFQRL